MPSCYRTTFMAEAQRGKYKTPAKPALPKPRAREYSRKSTPVVFWTPEENAYLRAQYGTMTFAEIGKVLGRTKTAVQTHAYSLGLTQGNRPGPAKGTMVARKWATKPR